MAIGKHSPGMLRQRALDLDLPDTIEDLLETSADVAMRLESARVAFEEREVKPEWYGAYQELLEAGWNHKVAIYVAWAAAPKKKRDPKTITELASLIGLNSPRVIYTWRSRNPAIDETVAIMQAAPLFQHRADVMAALIKSASDPNYKAAPDRRTFFTLTGDLVEEQQIRIKRMAGDLKEMTEEELAALEIELKQRRTEPGDE